MFNEPSEKELSLLPVLVHGVGQVDQIIQVRISGFSTQGQVALCLDGNGTFTDSNNHAHQIMPGDIFFFAPDTAHSYAPVKKPWIVKYIVFSGYELDSVFQSFNLPSSGTVTLTSELLQKTDALMDCIFTECKDTKASRHIISSMYMYRLLALISRCVNSHTDELTANIKRLSPAINYINKNFSSTALL